ncbi:uncharacterized protein LOC117168855 [Belonocnema kinseyi]|uniref:uncharacterized protein LOC117168855 n=1 Tax=Belonocnema kinseyi TaxID=2817044 RepID=UPI00143D8F80|nr:uncharacterized protein LOC117168855 [Belonocnema kinseyi]
MTDVHYNISITKRAFIPPNVNHLVEDVVSNLPIESQLFGEKLTDRIKAAEDIQKQSKSIAKKRTSSNRSSFPASRGGIGQQRLLRPNNQAFFQTNQFIKLQRSIRRESQELQIWAEFQSSNESTSLLNGNPSLSLQLYPGGRQTIWKAFQRKGV